jgi:hypothetical protein
MWPTALKTIRSKTSLGPDAAASEISLSISALGIGGIVAEACPKGCTNVITIEVDYEVLAALTARIGPHQTSFNEILRSFFCCLSRLALMNLRPVSLTLLQNRRS